MALAGRGDDAASTGTFVGVGKAEELAAAGVGVAVLSTDNSARGSLALPCPDRGRTLGGFEGMSVAVGVAVGV